MSKDAKIDIESINMKSSKSTNKTLNIPIKKTDYNPADLYELENTKQTLNSLSSMLLNISILQSFVIIILSIIGYNKVNKMQGYYIKYIRWYIVLFLLCIILKFTFKILI
jgi:Ca2+-dependent lipid-binding protein